MDMKKAKKIALKEMKDNGYTDGIRLDGSQNLHGEYLFDFKDKNGDGFLVAVDENGDITQFEKMT